MEAKCRTTIGASRRDEENLSKPCHHWEGSSFAQLKIVCYWTSEFVVLYFKTFWNRHWCKSEKKCFFTCQCSYNCMFPIVTLRPRMIVYVAGNLVQSLLQAQCSTNWTSQLITTTLRTLAVTLFPSRAREGEQTIWKLTFMLFSYAEIRPLDRLAQRKTF